MFEHYLDQHVPDRRRRLRLMVAAHLAALATTGALGFTWLMGKLQIAQVAPPTTTFVLVQMTLDTPLPPPPPPPPTPARSESQTRPEPDEPRDDAPPEDVTELLPPPKPRPGPVGSGPPTSTGTSSLPGMPGGVPGVPGIANLPPNLNPPGLPGPRPKPEQRPPVPLAVVQAQAIFTPNPDRDRLAATRAGMFDKRPGENETAFCVDASGHTIDIRTVKPFPNDPGVDAIIRATIKTWRFRPFMVDGRPVKTCTSQVFRITFK
ncbi:MAG TPA: hypothetical protein VIK91_03355 [Nannocystis sp.]